MGAGNGVGSVPFFAYSLIGLFGRGGKYDRKIESVAMRALNNIFGENSISYLHWKFCAVIIRTNVICMINLS